LTLRGNGLDTPPVYALASYRSGYERSTYVPVTDIVGFEGVSSMFTIDKILFPTDFSEISNQALPYAIKMAKLSGAELIMLHAVTLYEHDPNEVSEAAETGFQVCIDKIGDAGVEIRKAIVQGISPHAAILEFIRDEGDIGLIVMSTHGRSGFTHVLLGSVTENIIRYARCPVLVTKHPEHEFIDPKTGDVHIRKILYPFDFSEASLRPIEFLRFIAEMSSTEIIVFHSVDIEVPPIYYASGVDSILQLDPHLNDRVIQKMKDQVGSKLEGFKVGYEVQEGRAVDRIREYAAENEVDVIVMGSAGSHGIGDFLFGSTAARVIQKAVCPVLIV
jgi:nucleotide-binding universal stress UspA family protein